MELVEDNRTHPGQIRRILNHAGQDTFGDDLDAGGGAGLRLSPDAVADRLSDRFAQRLGALQARGIAVDDLQFDAGYGREYLEYYDGFVFGFRAAGLPPVSSGGRYAALPQVLGKGQAIPAVGGIIRPALVLEVRA